MFKLKMESYIFPEYADCQKTLVGASIARPCPFALQENCPGKCVAAVSWRATNGRPYTRNKARMQFFDGLDSVSCCEARCEYVKKWPTRMQIY